MHGRMCWSRPDPQAFITLLLSFPQIALLQWPDGELLTADVRLTFKHSSSCYTCARGCLWLQLPLIFNDIFVRCSAACACAIPLLWRSGPPGCPVRSVCWCRRSGGWCRSLIWSSGRWLRSACGWLVSWDICWYAGLRRLRQPGERTSCLVSANDFRRHWSSTPSPSWMKWSNCSKQMPSPSLRVWLRGNSAGRLTVARWRILPGRCCWACCSTLCPIPRNASWRSGLLFSKVWNKRLRRSTSRPKRSSRIKRYPRLSVSAC